MAGRARTVSVVLAMLVVGLTSQSDAQQPEATLTFQPHGVSTGGVLSLPSVTLATPIFVPRLPGGDGAVAALELRDLRGMSVFRAVFVNPPGFDGAVPISGDQGTRLRAGRYAFALAGASGRGLAVRASGLKHAMQARAIRTSRLRVRMLTTAADAPGLDAWAETVTSPSHAPSMVVALGATAGPGPSATESLCLSQRLAPTCIRPDHVGSNTSLSGPWLPPAPAVATQHEHLSWASFGSLAVPKQGVLFRGYAGPGTDAWHAVVQLTG